MSRESIYDYTEKVILGDGTELLASAASDGDGKIWVMMRDEEDPHNTIPGLLMALSAEGATDRIVSMLGEKELAVYVGYTEIDTIRMDSDGMCSARLRMPQE